MDHNIAVLKAKYRILKELNEVPCTKGEINYLIRHIKAVARNQAFDELISDGMVEVAEKQSFRPGRNPKRLSITQAGIDEFKRLIKEYK